MAAAFAICPHCNKNITLQSDVFDSAACSLCAGPLTMELLKIKNSIIDMEEANLSFEAGKQYFDNADFSESLRHFKKSLEYNANHYLSFYYAGLCDIYENERAENYDKILNLMRVLKYSILKLDSAQVDMQYKIPFILAAVREIYVFLFAEYTKLDTEFEKQNAPRAVRHRMMLLAKHINSFIALDKELLLVFNPEVVTTIVQLVNLGIGACIKSTQSRAVNDVTVSVPPDEDFDAASKIYGNLLYFAQSLDPNYSIESHKPDFITLGLYNRDALSQIDKYKSALGSKDRATFLSVKGDVLNYLKDHCRTALLYTYNVLYKNIYINKGDALRIDLLTQGVAFCIELLVPRISLNAYKRVVFESVGFSDLQQITPYLDAFLCELFDTNKKLATAKIEEFFLNLSEMAKMYFDQVYKTHSKSVNKMKLFKGKEFHYYIEFLINIVFATSLGLKESIEFMPNKSKGRLSLLKIGKRAADELLLLHDYKIGELEKQPVFSEVLEIYNSILIALDKKSANYYG